MPRALRFQGDRTSCRISVAHGCTTALTTQSSTKDARIGRDALLAVIPDPVTCLSSARYSQIQVFRAFPYSNLVIVDCITSGCHESREKWDFAFSKSTNHILLEGVLPLFLDSVLLEQGFATPV